MGFQRATKKEAKLRLAITGQTGSGKSYTALSLATALGAGEPSWKIAAIDTESGSLSLYSDEYEFDVMELSDFDPRNYVAAIVEAYKAGYDCLIIDSLSPAWNGKGGILEQKDQAGPGFDVWAKLTPQHNKLVEAIIRVPMHVIVTMRSKMAYVIETNERGKNVPRKVGLAPIQRENIEYEFSIQLDMSRDHIATVAKTRCKAIEDRTFDKPGAEFMAIVKEWLHGEPVDDAAPTFTQPTVQHLAQPTGEDVIEELKETLDLRELPDNGKRRSTKDGRPSREAA